MRVFLVRRSLSDERIDAIREQTVVSEQFTDEPLAAIMLATNGPVKAVLAVWYLALPRPPTVPHGQRHHVIRAPPLVGVRRGLGDCQPRCGALRAGERIQRTASAIVMVIDGPA